MEYNDSKNKSEVYEFYFHKLNKMLRNPEVIGILDKYSSNEDSSPLFTDEAYNESSDNLKDVKRNRRSTSMIQGDFQLEALEISDQRLKRQKTVIGFKKKQVRIHIDNNQTNDFHDRVTDQFDLLQNKLSKVEVSINKDIDEQMSIFEKLKLEKKQKYQNNNSKYSNFILANNFKSYIKRQQKIEECSTYYSNNASTGSDVLDSPHRMKHNIVSSKMLEDIQIFVEKNMNEMHKALEELKLSFEEEINVVDGKRAIYI